jgi:hypothetical protein
MISRSILAAAALLCAPVIPAHAASTVFYNPVTAAPYNAVCDGSTDDRNAIQAAIDAMTGPGYIDIPAVCAFNTTLDFKGHPNLVLRGQGGISGGGNTPSALEYGGTGARAIDWRDASAPTISGLTIFATNSGFTGKLVDFGATNPGTTISSLVNIDNVTIGATFIGTPPTCVNIPEAYEVTINRVNFSRCGPALKLQDILGRNVRVKITDSQFTTHTGPAIVDCGESLTFLSNVFEADVNGRANTFSNNSARPCKGMLTEANWHGDVITTGGTQYTITASGFTSLSDRVAGTNGTTIGYTLVGGTGYNWTGGAYDTLSAIFNCTSSPAGMEWHSNTAEGTFGWVSGTGCFNATAENSTPNTFPGGSLLPLPTWTPTWTPGGGSLPTTTNQGFYKRHANNTEFWVSTTFGSGVTATGITVLGGVPFTFSASCSISGMDGYSYQGIFGFNYAGNHEWPLVRASNPATLPAFGPSSTLALYANCPTN